MECPRVGVTAGIQAGVQYAALTTFGIAVLLIRREQCNVGDCEVNSCIGELEGFEELLVECVANLNVAQLEVVSFLYPCRGYPSVPVAVHVSNAGKISAGVGGSPVVVVFESVGHTAVVALICDSETHCGVGEEVETCYAIAVEREVEVFPCNVEVDAVVEFREAVAEDCTVSIGNFAVAVEVFVFEVAYARLRRLLRDQTGSTICR